MSEEIIKVLDALCAKLGVAIDWTSENVVPYLMELAEKYIVYEIATSAAIVLGCGVVSVIFGVIAYKAASKASEEFLDVECLASWVAVTSIILTIAFGIVFVINIFVQSFDIITALTLPELSIINFLKSFNANM